MERAPGDGMPAARGSLLAGAVLNCRQARRAVVLPWAPFIIVNIPHASPPPPTPCSGRVVKALLRGQTVAAKQCALRSAEAQEAFVAEALCLLQLSHQNVVALRGLCLDSPCSGTLLLEYCDGELGWLGACTVHAAGAMFMACAVDAALEHTLALSYHHPSTAGRDLHSVLRLRAAGSQERLFSW